MDGQDNIVWSEEVGALLTLRTGGFLIGGEPGPFAFGAGPNIVAWAGPNCTGQAYVPVEYSNYIVPHERDLGGSPQHLAFFLYAATIAAPAQYSYATWSQSGSCNYSSVPGGFGKLLIPAQDVSSLVPFWTPTPSGIAHPLRVVPAN